MIKYILIIGGILIAFLGDILQKEITVENKSNSIFKKFTTSGLVILFVGLFISILGVVQTYKEEAIKDKETRAKAKNDSTGFANKNYSDSIRFMAIIDKVTKTQNEVINKSNEIVSTTLIESGKILSENEKNKFLIPDEFLITYGAYFVLENFPDGNTELEIIRNFQVNRGVNGITSFNGIRLDYPSYKDTSNLILYQLYNLDHGIVECNIDFLNNNDKNIVSITNSSGGNLNNWKTIKSKKSDPLGANLFSVTYLNKEKKVYLSGSLIHIDVNKNANGKSLLNILNQRVKVRLWATSSPLFGSSKSFKLKLATLHIQTKDGLSLHLENFKEIGNNVFEKRLSTKDVWE